MIDVVFMLLIFFVWTASFRVAELILPSSLVSQSQGQDVQAVDPELEDLERVVVRLQALNAVEPNPNLAWYVNDVPVQSLNAVRERLRLVAGINDALPVLVDPDQLVPLGDVINVYDAAKLAGFQNVQFATPLE
jgi:biopolymer transport protein ExbD